MYVLRAQYHIHIGKDSVLLENYMSHFGAQKDKLVLWFYKEKEHMQVVFDKESKTFLGYEIRHQQRKCWHKPNLTFLSKPSCM